MKISSKSLIIGLAALAGAGLAWGQSLTWTDPNPPGTVKAYALVVSNVIASPAVAPRQLLVLTNTASMKDLMGASGSGSYSVTGYALGTNGLISDASAPMMFTYTLPPTRPLAVTNLLVLP